MSGPTFLLPDPPNGYQEVPAAEIETQSARFFGVDIWLDVAAPDVVFGQARYVTTASGDWAVARGREALRQSLNRRIITNPGEWATKPEYGVGARQFVKRKNTAGTRAELEARIREQFTRDVRVQSVDIVTITPLDDGSPGVIIRVHVTPRGRLRSDQPLVVSQEVR
jgi:phage baseplate assembly protein W